MEFEFWWLLALPLFFSLGWLAARVDLKQLLAESTALPAAYFKGLNFLITNQQDKAIEAFTEAVQANTDSLELHFALGSLFRKRGEVDRAIHLHLHLLEKKQLEPQQKLAVTSRWRGTGRPIGVQRVLRCLDRGDPVDLLHVIARQVQRVDLLARTGIQAHQVHRTC